MMFLLLVTLISMLLAAIMSVIAWRIAGDEQRRSDARVAALAAQIHDVPTAPRGRPAVVDELELRRANAVSTSGELFATTQPRAGSRWATVVGAGVLVLGTAAALVVVLSRGSTVGARGAGATVATGAAVAAQPTPAMPLELVALGHERDGDRLTVRGIVRNPGSGARMDRVTAVVFLFDRTGGFLASGRVAIEAAALRPGGASPFVLTMPGAGEVGRYRVSFRTGDRVVPHVDRRDPLQAKL
jgi:hypothetical protein